MGWVVENREGLSNSIDVPEPREVHYISLRLGADNHVPRGWISPTGAWTGVSSCGRR